MSAAALQVLVTLDLTPAYGTVPIFRHPIFSFADTCYLKRFGAGWVIVFEYAVQVEARPRCRHVHSLLQSNESMHQSAW